MWAPMLRRHWLWTSEAIVVPPPASADSGMGGLAMLGGRLRQVRPLRHARARRE